jgi:hypothetical protein
MGYMKEILKPNKSKFVLPTLAALLLLLPIAVNFLLIPKASDDICALAKYANEYKNLPYQNESYRVDADPEKVVLVIKQSFEIERKRANIFPSLRDKIPIIFFVNPFILQAAYSWIDPLYPIPCDIAYLGPSMGLWQAQHQALPGCRFYMNKEQYECLHQGFEENALGYSLAPRNIKDIPYRSASALEVIIHSLFIVLVVYILSSIIFYLPIRYKINPKLPYALIIFILLLIVSAILFNLFTYSKLFFGGIAPLENSPKLEEIKDYEYEIFYCQNTNEYNSTSVKRLRGGKFYVPEGYNYTILGCYKPFCAEICENNNKSYIMIELQGRKPSCVCAG